MKTLLRVGVLVAIGCIQFSAVAQPNVVFILSDDLSYRDLSCYGQTNYFTPRIDALAEDGLRFNTAYSGSPECAPSRASLMTGMHMGHCRVRANASVRGQEYLLDEDITVAEVLKQAGYATGFIGKWGIGLPGTEGVPDKQGFDFSYGYYDQNRAHGFYPNFMMRNGVAEPLPENYGFDMKRVYKSNFLPSANDPYENEYDENGRIVPAGISDPSKAKYSEDLFVDEALQFIDTNKDQPFFLYYATQLPHGPCITPDISAFADKPWDQRHKEWAAMVEHMDQSVGKIVDLLEELKLLENTVIFFAGDNGYSQWGYFKRRPFTDDPVFKNKGPWPKGKFTCSHEGGMRVPFFVYWKDTVQARDSEIPCALYDFLPTAAELAGVKAPETDGISLYPSIQGQEGHQKQHDFFYWEGGTKSRQSQSVRLGDWWAFRESPSEATQLFNLSSDLTCEADIASRHPEVVERVEQIFSEQHTESQWYEVPGDDKESVAEKKERAAELGELLTPVKANSTYADVGKKGATD